VCVCANYVKTSPQKKATMFTVQLIHVRGRESAGDGRYLPEQLLVRRNLAPGGGHEVLLEGDGAVGQRAQRGGHLLVVVVVTW